jgi:hypothetical protein
MLEHFLDHFSECKPFLMGEEQLSAKRDQNDQKYDQDRPESLARRRSGSGSFAQHGRNSKRQHKTERGLNLCNRINGDFE